jgi:hypothetical protein
MKSVAKSVAAIGSLLLPAVAAAGDPEGYLDLDYVESYANGFIAFINLYLVPLLMAVALIVFLYGIFKFFILGAADEKARAEGRKFALNGIIGFVIILSVWGIVYIVVETLNLNVTNTSLDTPELNYLKVAP